jgi:hypothetical protein
MLLTTVALSMAATPMLAEAGTYISMKIEKEKGRTGDRRIHVVCTVLYVMVLLMTVDCIFHHTEIAYPAVIDKSPSLP